MTYPMRPAHGNAVVEVVLQKTLEEYSRSSKSSVASFCSQSEDLIGETGSAPAIRFGQPPHSCHQRQTFTRDKRRGV